MKKFAIIASGLLAGMSFGQDLRPALQIKAIVGATVQVSPTKVLKGATILIKGNVITAVGTDVKVPSGAEVIDGKGLTVYAGFIDGLTTKGQVTPPELPRQDIAPDTSIDVVTQMRIGTAQNRADLLGADLFNPDDAAWGTERSAGFTAAVVSPTTGVIVGQPSLMALTGKPRRFSTIVPSVGVGFKFRGGFGFGGGGARVFPVTPLGFYSTARQALYDAEHWEAVKRAYDAGNPQWPDDDPALAALSKPNPFLFMADSMPEIDRTLDFGAEFSRPSVIVGAAEGYKILPRLKTAKAVILTLNFGTEPLPAARASAVDDPFGGIPALGGATSEAEPMSGAPGQVPTQAPAPGTTGTGRGQGRAQGQGQGRGQGQGQGQGGGRRRGGANDPDEPQEKKKENEALWLEKVKNAAALEKAGVMFALSTEGLDPEEFFTNLRRAVTEGLSKPAALAALTTTPAAYFGVSRTLGTIEPGKIANLTILTSDLFADGSRVKLLFIDGEKIDPAKVAVTLPQIPRFGDEE